MVHKTNKMLTIGNLPNPDTDKTDFGIHKSGFSDFDKGHDEWERALKEKERALAEYEKEIEQEELDRSERWQLEEQRAELEEERNELAMERNRFEDERESLLHRQLEKEEKPASLVGEIYPTEPSTVQEEKKSEPLMPKIKEGIGKVTGVGEKIGKGIATAVTSFVLKKPPLPSLNGKKLATRKAFKKAGIDVM